MTAVPLTTTYTPAPTCTLDIYTAGIYYSIGGPSPSSCFPSGWESTSQYFSPGLCPTGYTQACGSAVTAGTVTETHATCCPSGYACYTQSVFNFVGQACASIFLAETTTTVTNASNNQPILATFHPATEAVNGYGVSIRYQSTDFVSTTSGSGSSTSTSASSSPTSSSTSSIPTAMATSSGLSTGAKAGIGVGAAVVAVAVLIGIAMLFLARRRKMGSPGESRPEIDGTGIYEAPGETPMREKKNAHEIYTPPAELGGGVTP